jgi:tetratricopeptide (TPR) repeat protein
MSRRSKKKARLEEAAATRSNPNVSTSGKRDWIFGLVLVLAVIVVYQPVWHAGFIWDDDKHLTNNPCIIGLRGLKEIWTTSAARICPLVLTTFWLEHALWGLRALPYHLINVLMHAACAVLLWRVLRRLGTGTWAAWLGAALWALHPVQVESAAWITELKNTQSCLFYLLTILFFVKWLATRGNKERTHGRWNYSLALFCGALAMASKSSTVILPVALGLCAWWMEGRWKWRNLAGLTPFLLISVVTSGVSLWTQHLEGANDPEWALSWPERLVVAGRVVWFYLGKLLWPHPLMFIYPRWKVEAGQAASYLPTLAVGMVLFVLWWNRRDRLRPVFFTFAYFLAALLPVLGVIDHYFLRYSFVADHFQYLAGMGPLAMAAVGIVWLADFLKRSMPWLKLACCAGLLLTLGTLSWCQARVYCNVETLWVDTLQKNPTCWMAHNNLGLTLLQKGKVEEAITHFQKALAINPNEAEGHNNLGNALLKRGNVDEAIVHYQKALQITPDLAEAHNNLGNALVRKGSVDEAIVHYQKALQITPDLAETHNNLGNALVQKGNVDEAIIHYQKALQINPDYAAAHFNLGTAFFQKGSVDEAIFHYQKALEIKPDYLEAQSSLAWVLATAPQASRRDGKKAVALAERANQHTGGENPAVLHTLAAAYAEAGRFSDAQRSAQKAMELARAAGQPDLVEQLNVELKLYEAERPFHQESK